MPRRTAEKTHPARAHRSQTRVDAGVAQDLRGGSQRLHRRCRPPPESRAEA